MRIFTGENSRWDGKINFVDHNNVLVGYDMSQDCCESFGWFISNQKETDIKDWATPLDELNKELFPYFFDPDFFQEIDLGGECSNMAIFKLTTPHHPDKFLHLWCESNGYYMHGFSMTKEETVIRSGSL